MTASSAAILPLDKARPRGIMKTQKGAVDLTVGPIRIYKSVDRTGAIRAVNELLKAQKAFGAMFSMIQKITMRHSTKRRILRFSISPTPFAGKWPTAFLNSAPFARISPVASCEVAFILHIPPWFVNSFKYGPRAAL